MMTALQSPVATARFEQQTPTRQWTQAQRWLVGGVNSPVRAFRHVGGTPLILVDGRKAEVVDVTERLFVDFIMGWGALLLGHQPPMVMRALREALRHGTMLGLTHPAEIELARLIAQAVPSVEQVRFTASGTEACFTAVKLARAHTGRTAILTFDGCYHGHGESLIAHHSAGIPGVLASETLRIPYHDLEALEATMRRVGDRLACVIIEPVAANMGVIAPQPAYLARLRALTRHHGIVLIFDEVVTGFRVGFSGAQGLFGVRADLTTFGKIIGGGLPIGAVGGPRILMQRLAPEGDVYHGGTFAGHPLSMAAGVATLTTLKTHPPYERLEALSQRLAQGLLEAAGDHAIPVQVHRVGSMLTVFFSSKPVRNVDDVKASRRDHFARWATALREQGVLIPPSPYEAMCVSTAHTSLHVTRCVEAAREAFRSLAAT